MYSEKEVWYRAVFKYKNKVDDLTDDYHCFFLDETTTIEKLDKQAIKWAKERAKEGDDFDDIGHVRMELLEVSEVDGEKECFPEIRTVWY